MLNYEESKAIVSAINESFNGARKATDMIRQTLELSKKDSDKAQAVLVDVAIHLATESGKLEAPDSQQPKYVSFRNMVAREAQAMVDAKEWPHKDDAGNHLAWTMSIKKGIVSVAFKRKRAPQQPNGEANPKVRVVSEAENTATDTCYEYGGADAVLESLARQAKRAGIEPRTIVEYFGGIMPDDEGIVDIPEYADEYEEDQRIIEQVING